MRRSWLTPWVAVLSACAVGPMPLPGPDRAPAWRFFEEAPAADVWAGKIEDWQARQRRDAPALAARPAKTTLYPRDYALLFEKSDAFQRRERRALAARITLFSQEEARRHYRWDPETDLAGDPWPTSLELYERNGDDCDGLDLIALDLLVAFGFPPDQLYRVIVRRDRDGAHHMATLWFEDRGDPWVIDATGAITRRMRRFSELLGWSPVRVFDGSGQWAVSRAPAPPALDNSPR